MKKILIASSCAIMLCFTSCATKQAPQEESQTAPEIEAAVETSENENSSDTSQADTSSDEESTSDTEASDATGPEKATTEEAEVSQDTEEEAEEALTSENFPEPETIEEPEIITLEPIEEAEASESQPASEEVEKEEPPELIIVNSNEENTEENQEDASAPETESAEKENEADDISANDVVIISNPDSDDISGGIDITDDEEDTLSLSDIEKDITPSRSVALKKFEYLDVTYPGSGWIFMGLTDNSKDLAYFGRKLGTKDTKFTLQARASGTKIIHFYRNDPLTGLYLDDYIEVVVSSENGSNKTHIEAPEYKLPVQKKEKPVKQLEEESEEKADESTETEEIKNTTKEATTSSAGSAANTTNKATATVATTTAATAAATNSTKEAAGEKSTSIASTTTTAATDTASATASTSASSENLNPDSLLKEAQVLYNEKEYSAALKKLNQFFEYSTDNRDQALYLKGQILEAKSDVRDIKGSIEAYTTLTKNYPASKFWDSANKRIIYLKRFYLEVR